MVLENRKMCLDLYIKGDIRNLITIASWGVEELLVWTTADDIVARQFIAFEALDSCFITKEILICRFHNKTIFDCWEGRTTSTYK